MRILGYADRFSVTQGDAISFMASCDPPGQVGFAIERIICADSNPEGPGFRAEPVASDVDGDYVIGPQPIDTGSRLEIPPTDGLAGARELTLSTLFWPTLHKADDQCLVSCVAPDGKIAVSLALRGGRCGARIRTGSGEHWFEVDADLHLRRWYRASLALRGDACRVWVEAVDAQTSPFAQASRDEPLAWRGFEADALITIGAMREPEGAVAHYNGRIEAPRLQCVASGAGLDVGWDFSRDMDTDLVPDDADAGLDGRVVNLPTRAVKGHAWNGEFQNWRDCPGHYAAIHFHEDDLYDAGWTPGVRWRVPPDLPSGLYAAKLACGADVYRIPFAVVPREPGRTADVALLLPTASYYAYANDHCHLEGANPQMLTGRLLRLREADLVLASRGDLGLSLYDKHLDGSGNHFSSRLRPILNMSPGHAAWIGGPGSGLWQLGADTHLVDWLEARGFPYEVITDEDLHRDGAELLSHYRVVLTGTHPEYYSTGMWDGVDQYIRGGGRLMYMGGNGFYWRIAFSDRFPGAIEVRRAEDGTRSWAAEPGEYYQQFDGAYGGLWRRNGRPPQCLTGVGFTAQGFGESTYYRRTQASYRDEFAFIFDGVDDGPIGDFGLIGGGAAGLELDRHDPDLGSPETSRVLCTTEHASDLFILANEEIGVNRPNVTGEESPLIRADVVYTPLRGGGAVFSTGSIAWSGSLSTNNHDNNVSRITGNVLKAFMGD